MYGFKLKQSSCHFNHSIYIMVEMTSVNCYSFPTMHRFCFLDTVFCPYTCFSENNGEQKDKRLSDIQDNPWSNNCLH